MEFDIKSQLQRDHFDESIGVREALERYTAHLKWFVFSVLLFLVLAFFKMYFETPNYKVESTILIKPKDRGNSFADLTEFEDLGLFGSGMNNLENEMEILNSRKLVREVVEELKLNVRYYIEDSPIDREVFPNFPVIFHFEKDTLTNQNISSSFVLDIISSEQFEFIDFEEKSMGRFYFESAFKANLGNEEESLFRRIFLTKNENYRGELVGERIKVVISSVEGTTNSYAARINVEPVNERTSDVIKLSLEEPIVEKGIAVLNNLIEQYNADGINDKDLISKATTSFLDDRLVLISNELEAIETTAAQFKANKGLIDAGGGANIYLESSSITESEMVSANTQLQLVNYMLAELNSIGPAELLPGNVGLSDQSISGLISSYNQLVLQRNRVLKSSSEINPIVVGLDAQLKELRNNLYSSLKGLKSSAQIQIDALTRKSGNIGSKIASMPKNEKDYKDIVRDQETKNALYLFLLQKREESILSDAVKVEKAKVIDPAFSNGQVVSPNKLMNYLGALILGGLIPFLIIYVKDLLDTKVRSEKDLEKLGIPYIGNVPLSNPKKKHFIKDGDVSQTAEAFRYIRTNIGFMLDNKDLGKVVLVTSTLSNEGKTFTAINLASSLAISGKKTILLAMDLRAPKIENYLETEKNKMGITNFIKDKHLASSEILQKGIAEKYLDFIPSGDIPPNPVEILMSGRLEDLLQNLKETYEYIIIDSAPVGLVTDTLQISKYADLTIYVVKANVLDKRSLRIPEKLYYEKKLPNMAFLINGTTQAKTSYGYGYGYGQEKKTPWYKMKKK